MYEIQWKPLTTDLMKQKKEYQSWMTNLWKQTKKKGRNDNYIRNILLILMSVVSDEYHSLAQRTLVFSKTI